MVRTKFKNMNMIRVYMDCCDLTATSFTDSVLDICGILNSSLICTVWKSSKLDLVKIHNSNFKYTNMKDAEIINLSCENVKLCDITMTSEQIENTQFVNTDKTVISKPQ